MNTNEIARLRKQVGLSTEEQMEQTTSINLSAIRSEAKTYLEMHGCTVVKQQEGVVVTYPNGTTKQEIYPRTTCEWYKVLLPDGTELREVHTSHMRGEKFLYIKVDISNANFTR